MPGHSTPWNSPILRGADQLGSYHSKLGIHVPPNHRTATRRVHVHGRLADSMQTAVRTGDPILKQALKEPIAFWGGFVAGVLGLNLEEDPLKSWVKRTASDAQGTPAPAQSVQERSSWAMPPTETQPRNGVSPYSAGGREGI